MHVEAPGIFVDRAYALQNNGGDTMIAQLYDDYNRFKGLCVITFQPPNLFSVDEKEVCFDIKEKIYEPTKRIIFVW